jgi:hypothetical protein
VAPAEPAATADPAVEGPPAAAEASLTSVNGHSAVSARQPQAEVEPIDLLQSAGPAVAKRLAPVAVALVVVLLAARRRHSRRAT